MTDPNDFARREAHADHPNVRVHPPLVFLGAVAIGWVLKALATLSFGEGSLYAGQLPLPQTLSEPLGRLLIFSGAVLLFWSGFNFRSRGEKLRPNTETHQIIQRGPYRFSRNPIYLAFASIGLGLALASSNLWMVLAVLVAMIVIHFEVILREEAYLTRKFGESYTSYKLRVRRWI